MSDLPPTLYCTNHPTVETRLRCNNCSKPICPKCAVLTPTGYRCRECVRNQTKIFDTARWYDYLLAFIVATIGSFLGSLLASIMGFLTLFVAPIAGVFIAEAARFVTRGRRSVRLVQVVSAATVLGSLPLLIASFVNIFLGEGGGFQILPLVWQAVYTLTVTSTVYYRQRGIRV